jgi:hypothetical protein
MAADLDLDGRPDLPGLPPSHELPIPAWARNDGQRLTAMSLPVGPYNSAGALEAVSLADVVGDALPDLVCLRDGDAPRVARNLGNGQHWLALRLGGR